MQVTTKEQQHTRKKTCWDAVRFPICAVLFVRIDMKWTGAQHLKGGRQV